MTGIDNNKFIQLAIDKAWRYQFLTFPNPAVGACVVRDRIVLSCEAHREAGGPHAEVLALKEAFLAKYKYSKLKNLKSSQDIHDFLTSNHNDFFNNCEIYVTLEPCNHTGKTPACSLLLKSVNIKKVIIGTLDLNKKASGGKERLEKAGIEVDILNDKNCDNLLYPFIKWQKNNFVFFKLAIREDGTADGGYITTQDSLNLVHNIRTKIDLMVIGGETVRVDKPTLDARFSTLKKSPDILIYSKQKEFDNTIPLFNIKKRKITISNNLNKLSKNKLVMIEGGYNMLDNIEKYCDYLVLFVSHKRKCKDKFDFNKLKLKKIYSYYINKYDEIVFYLINTKI
jgi:diaminohydroxyphosphoribosylaminopyrimidine deaminase/5-amino-6-(5-phosphoribosylamino)uracil reductase